jgi:hypothetical protein
MATPMARSMFFVTLSLACLAPRQRCGRLRGGDGEIVDTTFLYGNGSRTFNAAVTPDSRSAYGGGLQCGAPFGGRRDGRSAGHDAVRPVHRSAVGCRDRSEQDDRRATLCRLAPPRRYDDQAKPARPAARGDRHLAVAGEMGPPDRNQPARRGVGRETAQPRWRVAVTRQEARRRALGGLPFSSSASERLESFRHPSSPFMGRKAMTAVPAPFVEDQRLACPPWLRSSR